MSTVVFIVFPIVFITFMFIIFQSTIPAIEKEQFLAGCPMPINNGDADNISIDGIRVKYTVTWGGVNSTGSFFNCFLDPVTGAKSVSEISKPYGVTAFNTIPTGWFAYLADSITSFFDRAVHTFAMLWLFSTNPPSQISSMPIFGYINTVLLSFLILGTYKLLRSGGD